MIINFEMDENSPALAWQARVAVDLAHRVDTVHVVTHRAGSYLGHPRLTVHVLPRWPQRAPLRWLGGAWLLNFYVLFLSLRYRVDVCFIHMNFQWAYRLWPVFRLLGVPVALWYAHGSVNAQLAWALRSVDRVVTSTKEGFRIPSDKVRVIGQGIDVEHFVLSAAMRPRTDILYVGRVSPRKRISLLIEVFAATVRLAPSDPVRLVIAGSPLTAGDQAYCRQLHRQVAAFGIQDRVVFVGHVSMRVLPALYETAFLHLNLSKTGSMDKTVIEALAVGCPVLTSNEAFFDLLFDWPDMVVTDDMPEAVAHRVLVHRQKASEVPNTELRRLVLGSHDLQSYCDRIVAELADLVLAKTRNGAPA